MNYEPPGTRTQVSSTKLAFHTPAFNPTRTPAVNQQKQLDSEGLGNDTGVSRFLWARTMLGYFQFFVHPYQEKHDEGTSRRGWSSRPSAPLPGAAVSPKYRHYERSKARVHRTKSARTLVPSQDIRSLRLQSTEPPQGPRGSLYRMLIALEVLYTLALSVYVYVYIYLLVDVYIYIYISTYLCICMRSFLYCLRTRLALRSGYPRALSDFCVGRWHRSSQLGSSHARPPPNLGR